MDFFLAAYALYGGAVALAMWTWSRVLDRNPRRVLPGSAGSSSSVAALRAPALNRDDAWEVAWLVDGARGALRCALVHALAEGWLAVEDGAVVTGPNPPPDPLDPLLNMLLVRAPGKETHGLLADEELLDATASRLAETRTHLEGLGLWRMSRGPRAPLWVGLGAVVVPALAGLLVGGQGRPLLSLLLLFAVTLKWAVETDPGTTRQGKNAVALLRKDLKAWRNSFKARGDVAPREWALASSLWGLDVLRDSPLKDVPLRLLTISPTDKADPTDGL